jgi:hypothetical protein
MKLKASTRPSAPIQLSWSHEGSLWRVTCWPEVRFERQDGQAWTPALPDEGVFFSAARSLSTADWQKYLEFVPVAERAVLRQFRAGRLAVLQVLAQCPELLLTLAETPALAAYVASHVGTDTLAWRALAAAHERGGVYELMRDLGLPSSRQTLAILRHLTDPDLPRRLLEPLRSMLWEPASLGLLQRTPSLTDRQLSHFWHALAA